VAVYVDRILTEVTPEPEPAPPPQGNAMPWEELDRWRALQARRVWDQLRTSAEGYDD
jgi:hypothetical protein